MAVTLDDLVSSFSSTPSARGAALGALMSGLLSAYRPPGGVNLGVDMSKVGAIAPRTTTYTPRYVPAAEYGARDVSTTLPMETRRALGIPLGVSGLGSMSQYTARPQMAMAAPTTIRGAGSGAGVMSKPILSPRGENTINPALGALMGAAIGSIIPSSSGGTGGTGSAGGTSGGSSNFWGNILNYGKELIGLGSGSTTIPNYYYDTATVKTDPNTGYTYTDFPVYKSGGLATPLMADGGQASYYTYGTPVNPRDIMNQMAHGGAAKHGGLHVPTVEGRHDYRAGAWVTGEGDGQSDDIPAMLADGEYVIDSETVAQLGNGSTKAGSDLLDKFREEIRAHKRSAPVDKIPPPSKSPLAYMKAAQKKVRSA